MRTIPAIGFGILVAASASYGGGSMQDRQQPAVVPDTIRFIAHNEHLQPGLVFARDSLALRSPFQGDAGAIATGAKLYLSYNCVDCHGTDGTGAMAPALMDGRWHFGGSPAEVFESIYQGRPDGMPAWGGLIDRASIWRLVAYVRSLEQGKEVSTENFTGKTVERTGH